MRLFGGNENVDKDRFISIMSNYVKSRQSKKRIDLEISPDGYVIITGVMILNSSLTYYDKLKFVGMNDRALSRNIFKVN